MKINEVDKVTTLAPIECITAIAADGSLIQIPVLELAKVMETLMPSLGLAFTYKGIIIKSGETKVIGRVNGIMVINFLWSRNDTPIYIVSSMAKKIDLFYGNMYDFLDFSFSDTNELLVSSRYSTTAGPTKLNVSFQDIIH